MHDTATHAHCCDVALQLGRVHGARCCSRGIGMCMGLARGGGQGVLSCDTGHTVIALGA